MAVPSYDKLKQLCDRVRNCMEGQGLGLEVNAASEWQEILALVDALREQAWVPRPYPELGSLEDRLREFVQELNGASLALKSAIDFLQTPRRLCCDIAEFKNTHHTFGRFLVLRKWQTDDLLRDIAHRLDIIREMYYTLEVITQNSDLLEIRPERTTDGPER